MLGRRPTVEFLEFMLRATSEGLLHHRSVRFIHDEIRADLLGRFETLEHGVLGVAAEHSRVIGQLARAVLESLGNLPGSNGDLRRRAADWESAADQLVNKVRGLARHSPRAQLYARLLGEADDVADDLEEAAFLLSLPPARADMGPARAPLLSLAALLVAGGQHWDKCLETAARVERGSTRESLQDFLDAVDRVVTLEDESDGAEREGDDGAVREWCRVPAAPTSHAPGTVVRARRRRTGPVRPPPARAHLGRSDPLTRGSQLGTRGIAGPLGAESAVTAAPCCSAPGEIGPPGLEPGL